MLKKFLFFLLFSIVSITSLFAQSRYTAILDSLQLKLKEVEPINIYVKTRFGKDYKFNTVTIVEDSLFFKDSSIWQTSFHARNLDEIKFYKPHPFSKWIGLAAGVIGSAAVLWFIDTHYGEADYRFGVMEYGLGTSVGGIIGYMIGRGLYSEEIIFDF